LQKNSPSVSAGASEPVTPTPIQPEPPPPPVADQPVPQSDEKSQNEPTPLAPAASSAPHRTFRPNRIQCRSQLKPAWGWDRRFRLSYSVTA
jgi:hypothetical protein